MYQIFCSILQFLQCQMITAFPACQFQIIKAVPSFLCWAYFDLLTSAVSHLLFKRIEMICQGQCLECTRGIVELNRKG